jgi:hypothetical protein
MFARIMFSGAAVLALAITVFTSGDALAGKGGNGGTTTEVSSIALNSPVTAAATTADASSDPRLGNAVSFTTHAAGLAGWEYPMVAIWCYQDGVLVYMELAHPDSAFVLGGGSSDWKTISSEADCEAYLYAYGSKGPRESIRTLAGTAFFAAAQ